MEAVQLVYAEVMKGITFSMLEDKEVVIISEGTVFLVTTEANSHKYDEEFYPVSEEAKKSYMDEFKIFYR